MTLTITKDEAIHAAIFDALTTVPGLAICERNRDVPVDAFPAVVLRDGGPTPDYNREVATIWWSMQPEIELFVDADEPSELGPAMANLYAKVSAAVFADSTLGGVAEDLVEAENEQVPLLADGKRPTMGRLLRLDARWTTAITTRT